MPLSGIHSVSIYVNDPDQAIDFYTNKLGFTLHDNTPLAYDPALRWITVSPPNSDIRFVLIKGYADWTPERVGIWTGIVFTVNDMVDTFKQMEAKGV
ncbi:MAG: VOC family protein, partial [Chloroflexia bacterium]